MCLCIEHLLNITKALEFVPSATFFFSFFIGQATRDRKRVLPVSTQLSRLSIVWLPFLSAFLMLFQKAFLKLGTEAGNGLGLCEGSWHVGWGSVLSILCL